MYYGSLLSPFPEGKTELDCLHNGDLVTTEGTGLRTNLPQLSLLVLYPHQEPGLRVDSGGVSVMPVGTFFRALSFPFVLRE